MPRIALTSTIGSKATNYGDDPRRFLIDIYQLTGSLARTAGFFGVDQSTVSKNLKECRLMGYEVKGKN